MPHVPYKRSGHAHPDLIDRQVRVMFDTASASMGHICSGKLRPLAVTSARRLCMRPQVPTTDEHGTPELAIGSWIGIVDPAGMTMPVMARLSEAMIKAAQSPDARHKFADPGPEVVAEPPDQFATRWCASNLTQFTANAAAARRELPARTLVKKITRNVSQKIDRIAASGGVIIRA